MLQDCEGNDVAIGDEVWLLGRITALAPDGTGRNVTVQILDQTIDSRDEAKPVLRINSRLVDKSLLEDGAEATPEMSGQK